MLPINELFSAVLLRLDQRAKLLVVGGVLLVVLGLIVYSKDDLPMWLTIVAMIAMIVGAIVMLIAASLPRFRRNLERWGIIDLLWFQGNDQNIGSLLARCKNCVVIQKTWFPEDRVILNGLSTALQNGASVKLILCKPSSIILEKRCQSTNTLPGQAVDWIIEGLREVVLHVHPHKFDGVALYDHWPACPVIWADDRVFMGFYFWGHTSPHQPWIEVKPHSHLWRVLQKQQNSLWDSADPAMTFATQQSLQDWLEENYPQGQIPNPQVPAPNPQGPPP